MAGMIDISVLGDKKLSKKLSSLPNRVQKKVVRQAMRKAGKPILADIKQKIAAIRVTGRHTDVLRKKTKLRSLKRSRSRVGVQIITPTREELGIPGDARYYWPAHIELGTSKTPALSYMRTAMDEKRQESLAIIRREIGLGITREAQRA